MRRRYSNFHRARKYHRKYLRMRKVGRYELASFYRSQYEKYDTYAYAQDGVNTSFVDVGTNRETLVIFAHFDREVVDKHIEELFVEYPTLRYRKVE